MTNEILDFLQKLLISKHGDLIKARYSISNSELSARCPYCLDSKHNTRKKRFYYSLKDDLFFCHNCGRKGPFVKLINDFQNLPNIDYNKLKKEIGLEKIKKFIEKPTLIQEQKESKSDYILEYPDGARLDILFENKVYKKLPQEDKQALSKVIKYLGSRGIKKEWFRYFYFVFLGEEYDQYILTLFEHCGEWVWSGRKLDTNRSGPKYLHVPGFPFHKALGFANEVSTIKGTTLYVVESWFSALLMNQANLNAVCVFGLMNLKYNHLPLNIFKKKYDIIFVPDNDSTFQQFCTINKEFARKTKIILQPDKDVGDFATRLGDKFRTEFLKLPIRSIYDQNIIEGLKTII